MRYENIPFKRTVYNELHEIVNTSCRSARKCVENLAREDYRISLRSVSVLSARVSSAIRLMLLAWMIPKRVPKRCLSESDARPSQIPGDDICSILSPVSPGRLK